MVFALTLAFGCASSGAAPRTGDRVDSIVKRGFLRCGIHAGVPGFAQADSGGRYRGLEVDICTAVATAILGQRARVEFSEVATLPEFRRTPSVDVAIRGLTSSLARAARHSMAFGPVYFFDSQGFLVNSQSALRRAADLKSARICSFGGLGHTLTLVRFLKEHRIEAAAVALNDAQEADEALANGECAAVSQDLSELLKLRGEAGRPDGPARRLLAETIAIEPLAPLVRGEDRRLLRILNWTFAVLVRAEERGITAADIGASQDSCQAFYARSTIASDSGKLLGLRDEWACDVLRANGNYGEMFARHFGAASATPLERGLNRIWSEGGMIYAPMLQ